MLKNKHLQIIKKIKFKDDDNHYHDLSTEFNTDTDINNVYNNFINLTISVSLKSQNFIIKLLTDIDKNIFEKIIKINKILSLANLTPTIFYQESWVIPEDKDNTEYFVIIKKHIENNIIEKENIANQHIPLYAGTLKKLHEINIDNHYHKNKSENTHLVFHRDILMIILKESTRIGIKTQDAQKLKILLENYVNSNLVQKLSLDNKKYLCHFDPIIANFIFNQENKFLIDLEYANICNFTGVIWDVCYFIITNKLTIDQEKEFLNHYLENNQSTNNKCLTDIIKAVNLLKSLICEYIILWYENLIIKYPTHNLYTYIQKEITYFKNLSHNINSNFHIDRYYH